MILCNDTCSHRCSALSSAQFAKSAVTLLFCAVVLSTRTAICRAISPALNCHHPTIPLSLSLVLRREPRRPQYLVLCGRHSKADLGPSNMSSICRRFTKSTNHDIPLLSHTKRLWTQDFKLFLCLP